MLCGNSSELTQMIEQLCDKMSQQIDGHNRSLACNRHNPPMPLCTQNAEFTVSCAVRPAGLARCSALCALSTGGRTKWNRSYGRGQDGVRATMRQRGA